MLRRTPLIPGLCVASIAAACTTAHPLPGPARQQPKGLAALPELPAPGPTVRLASGVVHLRDQVVGNLGADLVARFGTSDVEWPYLFIPLEARIRSSFGPDDLERCRLELPTTARVLDARRLLRSMTAAGCDAIEVASGSTTTVVAYGAPSSTDRPIKLLHAHIRPTSVVLSRIAAVHGGGRDEYEVVTVLGVPRREPIRVASAVQAACRNEEVMCARAVIEARASESFQLVALTVAAMRTRSVAPTKLSFVEAGNDAETNLAIIPRQGEGHLPRAAIEAVLSQHKAQFEGCYTAQPGDGPRVSVTRFSILRTGAVSDVQASDPRLAASIAPKYHIDNAGVLSGRLTGAALEDPNALRCIHEVYAALSFPEPEDGVRVVVHSLVLGAAPPEQKPSEARQP